MRGRRLSSVRLRAITSSAALIALGGCATFGGNVKGSFSCAAPDGICAPSSSIDDRALAMIAGESGAGATMPAGPYMETRPKARTSRMAATGQRVPLDRVDPRRTQERVLRIVFQPYIDEQGRLHEASAIHAVVQSGEWQQQALASATAIPDRRAQAGPTSPTSLAEALDRADPAFVDVTAIDPNLPDPAVVAAARARAAGPVEAIKNDVAARLAPKAGRTPTRQSLTAAKRRETGQRGVAAPVPTAISPAPAAVGGPAKEVTNGSPAAVAVPVLKTTSGTEAAARVKASPEYQVRSAEAEQAARQAAAPDTLPGKAAIGKPTVRAAGFPSGVPEDN